MDIKKFLFASLAAIIGSGIAFGILELFLFKDYLSANVYEASGASVAGDGAYPYWVASLAMAFVMAYIYPKGYEGGAPSAEGLKFGVLMGLFSGIPFGVYFDQAFPIGAVPALVLMLVYAAEVAAGGWAVGMYYAKS